MEVAVSGDRGCVLSARLAPATYLFAVAHGFGTIDGEPPARVALGRLRGEFERRSRNDRLRRVQLRPKAVTGALIGALARVNGDLYSRSASHDDYVTSGCSVTAALVIDARVYLAHVGSTAAYLSRDGYVVGLTKDDAFDADGLSVLTRAVGIEPHLEVAVCSFALTGGDALVLSGRRTRTSDDRRRLSEQLVWGPGHAGKDDLLIVRYDAEVEPASSAACAPPLWRTVLTTLAATAAFYAALCLQ
ncbi:MAG TPA: hypothetical protein VIG32_06705 [Candidatus Baltobacteraceae bacterium]|jgi:hypothetical protein